MSLSYPVLAWALVANTTRRGGHMHVQRLPQDWGTTWAICRDFQAYIVRYLLTLSSTF
jgi:hypothetical protein